MRVPIAATGALRSPAARPLHPPLIGERTVATAAKAPTAARPKTSNATTTRWQGIAHSRPLIAAVIVLFASSTALTAWLRSGRQQQPRVGTPMASNTTSPRISDDSATTTNDVQVATVGGELKSSLFGVPVDGNVVAYIVDSDTAMSQYIDKIAAITNFVNKSIPTDSRRYGIVRNTQQKQFALLGTARLANAIDGGDAMLSSKLPVQRTEFGQSLAMAANWYADEVFLMVARPLSQQEVDTLAQNAEQTGAITHVVAVGPAAQQDLSPIARATGGRFIPLTDAALADWSSQYTTAAKSSN